MGIAYSALQKAEEYTKPPVLGSEIKPQDTCTLWVYKKDPGMGASIHRL
ncbi:hypothetical protein [Xanthocytophaga agilis]|uniref:Uncharacterized protein n=1 Tax=Xanthocytophaga agilis TaxID=3048010 RepID=A0AAE3R7S9_9BACT|nr:hypothetical protein [Xanthocytophaga agilis]MDJ1503034.1 hypothetical protein [Xanthocytophaga agilis]